MEILYGRQPLMECLRAGRRELVRLHLQAGGAGAAAGLLRLARSRGVPVVEAEKRVLDRLTRSGHHQGAVLEAGAYPYLEAEALLGLVAAEREPAFLLLLDRIQDPQNLGSLLRSADAAGAHGVMLPRDRCAGVTPAVVRASSGASEHVRIARVSGLRGAILDLRSRGVRVVGLDCAAEAPYGGLRAEGPIALVVGSEGEGMTRGVRDACDERVRIPMRGAVASLNAGVAGALLLFHLRAVRAAGPGP